MLFDQEGLSSGLPFGLNLVLFVTIISAALIFVAGARHFFLESY